MKYELKILSLDVTGSCNNNCSYCRGIHRNKERDVSSEDFLSIIKKLIQNVPTIEWVKISGGEPLLIDGLYDILAYCSNNNIKTILQTNGILLTDEVANKLKEAGLLKVQLSLDGNKKIHNKLRDNSFDKIVAAMINCRKNELSFQLKCTISNLNKNHLEDVCAIGLAYGAEKINYRFIIPVGDAISRSILKDITKSERKEIVARLKKLSYKYRDYFKIDCGDPCSFVYKEKYLSNENLLESQGKCNIGINSIHVSSDCHFRPCSMIEYNLGDALVDDVRDIWKHPFLDRCRKKDFDKCGKCINAKICGGCRAVAYNTREDYFSEDDTCFIY